jgi:GNAT superfamily N-acetyltransferase
MPNATSVTTFYLQMLDPSELVPATRQPNGVEIRQAVVPSPELNRYLYCAVGGDWHWHARLEWTYSQWVEYLFRPEQETWIAYLRGTPAGYIELDKKTDGSVEIVYFGLLPQFIGRGIGGYFLTTGIRRAWEMGANRVWVHTCTLDHPKALANYEARGLKQYKQDEQVVVLPSEQPGPWPGAQRPLHAEATA